MPEANAFVGWKMLPRCGNFSSSVIGFFFVRLDKMGVKWLAVMIWGNIKRIWNIWNKISKVDLLRGGKIRRMK